MVLQSFYCHIMPTFDVLAMILYSEGTSLSQEDDKGYYGKIEGDPSQWSNEKIEIKGTVIQPPVINGASTSVGRFKMIEIEDVLEEEDAEEEDEDEYVEMSADDVKENADSLDSMMGTGDTDLDDSSDPFDLPGSFG